MVKRIKSGKYKATIRFVRRQRARTWELKHLVHENPELWLRCRSLHAPSEQHVITYEYGATIGFSMLATKRKLLLATCLRCGATFSELDEVKHDLLTMFDVAKLVEAR